MLHCVTHPVAGNRQLKSIRKILRDQNDQTERKIEHKTRKREERLVIASLLSRYHDAFNTLIGSKYNFKNEFILILCCVFSYHKMSACNSVRLE